MKISNKFSQFEKFPALFITSGEYEADLYIAFHGKLELEKIIKMPPRENAKEKQAFVGKKGGMQSLSAVSHHGSYLLELKRKFAQEVYSAIKSIVETYKLEEIYIFAPKFATDRILSAFNKDLRKKVRMQFYKEYTKENPIRLIEIFQKEIDQIQNEVMQRTRRQTLGA